MLPFVPCNQPHLQKMALCCFVSSRCYEGNYEKKDFVVLIIAYVKKMSANIPCFP
jgi:hypothetical protein